MSELGLRFLGFGSQGDFLTGFTERHGEGFSGKEALWEGLGSYGMVRARWIEGFNCQLATYYGT